MERVEAILEPFEPEVRREIVERTMLVHEGPLPPASLLRDYDAVVPGLAREIADGAAEERRFGVSGAANAARGEASLRVRGETLVLRPSFAALVAAEGELGSLFALVERAAAGRLMLGELVALLWHCLRDPVAMSREEFAEAVTAAGIAAATPALKMLIAQILGGR